MEWTEYRMTLNEYQEQAARTSSSCADRPPTEMSIAISALGLAGEAGEVADLLKKVLGHGHEMDREKLSKELGDVLWYVADLATLHGLKLSDIAEKNIAKLKERYPEGFSHEASRNRKA